MDIEINQHADWLVEVIAKTLREYMDLTDMLNIYDEQNDEFKARRLNQVAHRKTEFMVRKTLLKIYMDEFSF